MAQKDELQGVQGYTVSETQNLALGQAGSIYIAGTTNAVTPPLGNVFVAIQVVTAATFDSGVTGLVGENDNNFPSTTGTGTDIDSDGGAIVDGVSFPAGLTIYGRWTSILLDAGSVIAYVG